MTAGVTTTTKGTNMIEVAVQVRGGSVIFDPLTVGFVGSAVFTNALMGAMRHAIGARLKRAISQEDGSFVGS